MTVALIMKSLTRFKAVVFLLFFAGILVLHSCSNNSSPAEYLARVEDSYLTPEDMKFLSIIDPEGQIPPGQLQSFLNNWIETEMLAKQALRYDIDQDPYLQSRLDSYYKSLLADTYMRYHIYRTISVSDQEIQDYYDENRKVFMWEHDAAELVHYFTENRDTARSIYNILRNGTPEEKTVLYQQNQPDTRVVTYQDVIPELGDVIFNTRAEGVLNIIESDFGFHVVVVNQRYSASSFQDINQVRDEIRERIILTKQKQHYYDVLDSLKGAMDIEINQENYEKYSAENSTLTIN